MTPTQKIDSLYFMVKQTIKSNIKISATMDIKKPFGRKTTVPEMEIIGIHTAANTLVEKILLMMFNNGKHGSYINEPECTWEQYKEYWSTCIELNKAHIGL